MDNTRSYLSRFSGLLLFLLTLLVVGVLVVLTIRAASDDDSPETVNVQSDSPEFIIENTTDESNGSEGVVATADESQNMDVNSSTEAAVASAVDLTTDAASGSESTSEEGAAAGVETLPDAGAETSILIGIVAFATLTAFASSRRDLLAELKA